MPEFVARIGSSGGEIAEKAFVASSADALRGELEEKGYHVFAIRAPGVFSRLKDWIPFAGRTISADDFLLFNQQLAALLKAGVPLLTSLDALCERRQKGKLGEMLREIRDEVKGGSALSAAFAARAEFFPASYPATLASGEHSGELAMVVSRYIKAAKAGQKLRRRVASAFIYPAFILSVAVIAGGLILVKVLPTFQTLFTESGTELPAITRTLIALSEFIRFKGYYIPIIGFALWWGFGRIRRSKRGADLISLIVLHLPLFGGLLRRYALAQHARTLAALLAGGMPLADANQVAARACGNRLLGEKLSDVTRAIREGSAFWEATRDSGASTDLAIEMIRVGEASGSLSAMLGEVSEYYDNELDDAVTRMLSILEPLLLVFCALIVAFMLVAIYLPLLTAASASPN